MFDVVICLAFQTLLKIDLLRNPDGMRSSIVHFEAENSALHKVEPRSWFKNEGRHKLLRVKSK